MKARSNWSAITILSGAIALVAAMMAGCSGEDGSSGSDADSDADSDSDSDADADTDSGTGEECVPVEEPPWLEPDDISFLEIDPPLGGSFIYYGVWGSGGADSLEMITPDGQQSGTRFEVHRLWSFGAAHDGETIAFSSLDPYQQEHWCLSLGDAIQYSWLWEPGSEPVQITSGAINDECHLFSADDSILYLCRRASFWQQTGPEGVEFGNDPYRILTHELVSGEESWLTPLAEGVDDIGPAPRADGSILFWRQTFEGGTPVQTLMEMESNGSAVAEVLESATNPVTSPDGSQLLFRMSWRELRLGDAADPAAAATIVDGGDDMILDYDFSPAADRVVYTRGRQDASCSDIWVSQIDGSDQTLLVDCVEEETFVSGVQWVEVAERN